jgi:hypothetical protein
MTQREQKLLKLLGIVVGALFLAAAVYLPFVTARDYLGQRDEKADLTKKLSAKKTELEEKERLRAQVATWRSMSLPFGATAADMRYREMLVDLARKHQLAHRSAPKYEAARKTTGGATGDTSQQANNPSFTLELQATLPRLIAFLRDFYSTNYPHQIKEFLIEQDPKEPLGTLTVRIRVEVLAMPGVPNREWLAATPNAAMLWVDILSSLKHGPTGLAVIPYLVGATGPLGSKKLASTVTPAREYERMVAKNPFIGLEAPKPPPPTKAPYIPPTRPPPETKPVIVKVTPPDKGVLKNYQLTSIHTKDNELQGSLLNRDSLRAQPIGSSSKISTFEIKDKAGKLVLSAKVRKVMTRVIVLEADKKLYALYVGDYLDKMKELNESDLEKLEKIYAASAENN